MKKLMLGVLLFPFALSATQYVSLGLGTNNAVQTDSHKGEKIGYKGALRYGYIFDEHLAGELEFHFRKNHADTKYSEKEETIVSKEYAHHNASAYMANLIYSVNQISFRTLTPYIGLGFGYCENTHTHKMKTLLATHTAKKRDNRFAYQGIFGLKVPVDLDYALALQYNYFIGRSHGKDHSFTAHVIRHF